MASNIIFTNIDDTFPIAGRDNDSQGFRDNFSYIKNNFEAAKNEIEDLQLNAAFKNEESDFNNQKITQAVFYNCSEQFYADTVSTNTAIDYINGNYQKFTVQGNNVKFTLTGFPLSGRAAKITVEFLSNTSTSLPAGIPHSMYFDVNYGGTLKLSPSVQTLTADIQCTATADSSGGNKITCTSTAQLKVNHPIKFSGTAIGSIVSGTTYFVKQIFDSTTFSISSSNTDGVAGTTFALTTASGTSMVVDKSVIVVESYQNPMIFEFWTVDGGSTVMMDYKGLYI